MKYYTQSPGLALLHILFVIPGAVVMLRVLVASVLLRARSMLPLKLAMGGGNTHWAFQHLNFLICMLGPQY